MVGLFSLLPAVVDAVRIPVVATGGIADARGVAAALLLGASAVQIGTGFLRSPEAGLPAAWADELARTAPEETRISRVFSGRAGRSIATDYVRAATAPDAPAPAPYPVQRDSRQGFVPLGRRRATPSACRSGPASPQRWPRPSPRPRLCANCGTGPGRCWPALRRPDPAALTASFQSLGHLPVANAVRHAGTVTQKCADAIVDGRAHNSDPGSKGRSSAGIRLAVLWVRTPPSPRRHGVVRRGHTDAQRARRRSRISGVATPPIILVPGFWLGAWAWDEVAAILRAEGSGSRR